MFEKPISADLSPNTERDDVSYALKKILNPFSRFSWTRGVNIKKLDVYFKNKFNVAFARSFNSGRVALQAILDSLDLKKGDKVIVQSLTCIVVPNAIQAAGAIPLYLDIDGSYNISPETLNLALEQEKEVKVVIAQHTFGQPAKIEEISKICQKHNVFLIEDCAHSLGAKVNGKLVGTFGDAAMFSFGRDKVVSSVFGGLAITNNSKIGEGINRIWKASFFPNFIFTAKNLRHTVLFAIVKKLYYFFSLGKVLLVVAQKIRLIPLVLNEHEKQGRQGGTYRYPNVLAGLTLRQLKKLDRFNNHRQDLAEFYKKELTELIQGDKISVQAVNQNSVPIYLRFAVQVKGPVILSKELREHKIILGNWYNQVIAPSDCSLQNALYKNDCPNAEKVASQIVNLPTNINTTQVDAEKIVKLIKKIII